LFQLAGTIDNAQCGEKCITDETDEVFILVAIAGV
jgi:hypothetical protein